MKSISRTASALLASLILLAPAFAFAADINVRVRGCFYQSGVCVCYQGDGNVVISNNPAACSQLGGVAGNIISIINNILVPLLFAVAFIVFLWGIFKAYILNAGDEAGREQGHKLVLWGIIGFVVMLSLWGLVNVVSGSFGLQNYTAPPPPTSY